MMNEKRRPVHDYDLLTPSPPPWLRPPSPSPSLSPSCDLPSPPSLSRDAQRLVNKRNEWFNDDDNPSRFCGADSGKVLGREGWLELGNEKS
ncbi:hypothetical protein D0Y65_004926 [Glycine soja]|uniref:Uncharacterized protein n=1 Tax=Glycine soja TaxID=3848 RepID=A0A445LTH5_GLYSO|nr:hypothetical protein D0Y65_004926 [Glycine soja]